MQQQQVVYPQTTGPVAPPQQIIIVTQPNNGKNHKKQTKRSVILEDYQTKKSKRLGAAVVTLGILAIVFGACNLGIQTTRRYYDANNNFHKYFNVMVAIGSGFWAGTWYVIAGSLAIRANTRPTVGMVKGTLANSIIALLLGITDFSLAITGIMMELYVDYPWEGVGSWESTVEDRDEEKSQVTMALCATSMLIAFTTVGLCIAISNLAGKVICGRRPLPAPQQTNIEVRQDQMFQIQHSGIPQLQSGSGAQVMYITNPGVSQAGQFTQQAPLGYYNGGLVQPAGAPQASAEYTTQASAPSMTSPPTYNSLEFDEKPTKM